MDIQRSRTTFRVFTIFVTLLSLLILATFLYLFFTQPQIVPPTETFGSFWVKNFAILIAALSLAGTGIAAYYNSLEQRHLRYVENYPYLAVFPILSVDPLPLPIPRVDVPVELSDFNTKYLKIVAPSHQLVTTDNAFRYLAVVLRNVGHGLITRVSIRGIAEVPNTGFDPVDFEIDRRVDLHPGETLPFTLLPIEGLPEYQVILSKFEYWGHFVKLQEFDGHREFRESHPYTIPEERRDLLFLDEFVNIPAGNGWQLDFWGAWQPTDYMKVPYPAGDDHFLLMKGNASLFSRHYKNQGGAYKDLLDCLEYGQTVEVTARVRSTPGTNASIQIWCHDLQVNPKNRFSEKITPQTEWQEISMLYTSTQPKNMRIHLLYFPGDGEIHVDKVMVEVLHT